MAEHHTTEVIVVHLEYLRKAADETNTHLRVLNGRMGKAENRLTAVETRAEDATRAGGTAGRNWGAGTGAAGGFLGGFVATFIQRLIGGGQ